MTCRLLITFALFIYCSAAFSNDEPSRCVKNRLSKTIAASAAAHAAGLAVLVNQVGPNVSTKSSAEGLIGERKDNPSDPKTPEKKEVYATKGFKNKRPRGTTNLDIDVIDPPPPPPQPEKKITIPEPVRKKVKSKTELIAEAREAVRMWKEKKEFKPGLAEFILQTELVTSDDLKNVEISFANYSDRYYSDVSKIQKALKKSLPSMKTLEDFRKQLHDKYFHNYYRSNARLADYYLSGQGNCVSQTLVTTSTLQDLHLAPPSGWIYGIQVFSDHVQPVIYNRTTNETIELVSGAKVKGAIAPIYQPAILYVDYLKSQNIDPHIDYDNELLVTAQNITLEQRKHEVGLKSLETNAVLLFNIDRTSPRYSSDTPPLQSNIGFQSIHNSTGKNVSGSFKDVYGNVPPSEDNSRWPIGIERYKTDGENRMNITMGGRTYLTQDTRILKLTDDQIRYLLFPYISPSSRLLAENKIEKDTVSASPLGIAFVHPIRRSKMRHITNEAKFPEMLTNINTNLNEQVSRKLIFKDNALKEKYSKAMFDQPDSLLATSSYEFFLNQMIAALNTIGRDPRYLDTIFFLKHPDVYSNLSIDKINGIQHIVKQLQELTRQMGYITDLLHAGTKSDAWKVVIEKNKIWNAYEEAHRAYFEHQNSDPKNYILKLDQLDSERKREFFRLNDSLGGARFSDLYNFARYNVELKTKDEEQLELALEKATFISLSGTQLDTSKSKLQPTEVNEKEFFRKGTKKLSKKDHKHPSQKLKLPKSVKVQPDTLLGLMLLRHDKERFAESSHDADLLLSPLIDDFYDDFYHDSSWFNSWSPRLLEEFTRQNKNGDWDTEFVNTILKSKLEDSIQIKQLKDGFGSLNIVEIGFVDARSKDDVRSREEGGDFPIGSQFEVPEKLLPLIQAAYKRKFGDLVKIQASKPREVHALPKDRFKDAFKSGIMGGPGFGVPSMGMDPPFNKPTGGTGGE